MSMPSLLEDQIPLARLMSTEELREVCLTFSELYGIGLKIYDIDGAKIADVRAATGEHCSYLFSAHPTKVLCTAMVSKVRTSPLDPQGKAITHNCFSGLRYRVLPLMHNGSVLGRLILGPYRPAELKNSPEGLKQYQPAIDHQKLDGFVQKLPAVSEKSIEQIVDHMVKVTEVLIHSAFKSQITTQLHVASISDAFQNLERVNGDLRRANEQLKELDRLKSNFISTVSHELRTPLTSVIGYSEMLIEGMAGDLNKEQKEYVTTILEKGESLLTLISEILDLSRIESGNVIIDKELTPIKQILDLCISDILPQAQKRQLEIISQLTPTLPPIEIDRDKIRRVLTNLLGNAVKFTRVGGKITISASSVRRKEATEDRFASSSKESHILRICVEDTGMGIDQKNLDRIFDSFFQVDNSSTREFGGTGLGLAIARNFVQAHGGYIQVHSEVGKGSAFCVHLPYTEGPTGDDGTALEMLVKD